jgi:tight adherence protein C
MMRAALLAGLATAAGAVAAADGVAVLRRARSRPRRLASSATGALLALGRRLGRPAPPRDLRARLDAAGRPGGLGVGDLMAVKAGAAAAGLLGGLACAPALSGRLVVLAAVAGPAAGFVAPDLWLRARTRARAAEMARALPDLLDLLRVAVEAGLSLDRSLGEVGRRHGGALAREWARAAYELELGLPREHALAGLRARCPAEGIGAFVAALERAGRHGAPLSATLAGQAADARSARARRIREDAARAAPKIQLVIALALVPSVLLLVAAALVGSLLPPG